MDLITAREAAKSWGITVRRVQALCENGQVPAAYKLGDIWVKPSTKKA